MSDGAQQNCRFVDKNSTSWLHCLKQVGKNKRC